MANISPRVLMVVTRDIPAQAESGRERTMSFIKRALSAGAAIDTVRLYSVLERRSVGRILSVMWAALSGLLRSQPIPLQTLLFYAPGYAAQLDEAVRRSQPQAVYFDGVRSGIYALALRRRYPQLNLVCDFDDLMSRRIEVLAERRQPISVGYLKKLVPGWVQKHLLDGVVARAIQAYEHRALRGLENRISQACDKVVLVSSVDARHLREQQPGGAVEVIPPFMEAQRPLQELKEIKRFIFIGADSLLQNRLTIEYLVAAWQRLRPETELHIFGKLTGSYPQVERVSFRGFIDDVADAYETGSVLLAPSFVGGGVKTKVLEAFSHGVIPVGTETTFEGIHADCCKLTLTERQLEDLIQQPQHWLSIINSAGAIAAQGVANNHSSQLLGQRWRNIVWPEKINKRVANL
jgi:glycosyltransferase involved in cell wall biosynthesis